MPGSWMSCGGLPACLSPFSPWIPAFAMAFKQALHCLDNMGAYDPGIHEERASMPEATRRWRGLRREAPCDRRDCPRRQGVGRSMGAGGTA